MRNFRVEIAGLWVVGAVAPGTGGGGGAAAGSLGIVIAVLLTAMGVGVLTFALVWIWWRRPAGSEGASGERFASGEVLADLDELSRRLADELEEKAARLERLLAEADERIARLEPVVRRMGGNGHGSGAAAAPAAVRRVEGDPLNEQVYEMADRGCSVVEIAQSLGQHVGKVELILALRR